MQLGDGFEGGAEGDGVVGGAHGVVVLEVDLVLADGHLVVAGLHDDAQFFEGFDHLLAHVGGFVGGEIEVAGRVVGQRLDAGHARGAVAVAGLRIGAAGFAAQHEEFQLGTGHVAVAELFGAPQLAAQHPPRIAHERLAVGGVDVTDDFGSGVFAALPGDDAEGL